MKLPYVAAASLLLGTSALAWAPSSEPVAESGAKSPIMAVQQGAKAPHPILVAKSNDLPAMDKNAATKTASWDDKDAKMASADGWLENDGLVKTASADSWAMDDSVKTASADMAPLDLDLAEAPKDYDKTADVGVGGPFEEADQTTAPQAVTQTAMRNYPPCNPGPGDDNCIQLYEPGVRTSLASWNNTHGGLMEHQATNAMGGPYEPVTEAYAANEMATDDSLAAAMGENGTYATEAHEGMGGPTSETGYPACSSTVTDSCIQLYERGVTGEGN